MTCAYHSCIALATVKDQARELIESQRREMAALQRAGEHEAQVEPLRHRIARLETDVTNAKQQSEWLESQVAEKTKFTHELRKTLSQQTHDLEELKMKSTEELTSAKRQLESARQVSKKLESSLIQSKELVKEAHAAKAHDDARFEHELSAQRRLAELYKESASDATARVTELQELCDALRQSLAETEEALALETERTKAQVEHLFAEQAAASEKIIETLQAQLQDANHKIEDLEKKKIVSLQTAASVADLSSAAGEAHLAAHGVTPKELCDHIVELEATLQDERSEKEKLQLYMDRIVREVQEKAPIIMGLRLDHERAVASHAQMTERLDACMQALATSKRNETLARTDKRALETKCAALTQSVDDLSRQVQHLLFRTQQTRTTTTLPGDVVSENLVVFKDVAELQVRNQQLLTVIRELSDAAKRSDTHLIASNDSDDESERGLSAAAITARLAQARDEVQELRAEREQERQMIAAIVKQRDMYRVLLAQSDTKFLDSNDSSSSSAPAPAPGTATRRASFDMAESKTLRDLQTEFADYKKEKQMNTKLLQDALDSVRAEASAARLAQLQAEVDVKCASERLDASESRRRDIEDECVRVRSKNEQLSALLLQQQQQLSDATTKLDDAVAQAQRLAIEKASAVRDAEFLKKHELKLQQELTSLRLDNTNVLKLMESTRRMDAMRDERAQRETDALTQKVSSLESQLQDAHAKHDAREALASANLLAAEQEKKAAQVELDKIAKRFAETHERVVRLEEQKAAADSTVALLEKDVTHLREQLRKGAGAAAAERVAALEVQLRDAQRDVQASLVLRKSLTENVSRYKAIAEAHEKSLAELSRASDAWKATQERKLEVLEAERQQLQDDLATARARVKEHVTELHTLRTELDQVEAAHREQLSAAQEQQRAAEIRADGAQREIATLRDEIAQLQADVATTQSNYERELQLHAAEVAKASAARKVLEDEQAKRQALAASVSELETRLAAADNEAQRELARLRQDVRDAAEANESLTQQNKLLHAQLERAATQVRRAHEQELMKSVLDKRASADAAMQQHDKEVDDLRSVIAFLRRESDIASSKLDVAQQEVQRYRAQVFSLESTTERLRDEIKALAATASAASTTTSSGDATVSDAAKRFAQLEQLSLLRESNATLRDESQKSLAKLRAEEAKVAALDTQLAPLRASEAALKSRVAALEQEVATLNEANKRWKQRVDQLVEKYQQVDPAEHDKVVAEHAALTQEIAALKTSLATVQTELETLRASEGKSLAEEQTKVENWRKQYDRIKGFAKTWKTKAENLSKQVAEKTKELEDKTAQLTDVDAKVKALEHDRAALESKLAAAEASKQDSGDAAASLSAQNEKERVDLRERLEAEQKKSTQLKDFNQRLMTGLKALKKENTELRGQAAAAAAAPSPPVAADQSAKDDESAASTSSDSVTTTAPAATVSASSSAPETPAPVALKPVAAAAPVQPPLPPLPPASSAPKHTAGAAAPPLPTAVAPPAAAPMTTTATTVAPPAPPAAAPPANVVSFMKSPPAPPTPAPAPPAPFTAVTSASTPPTASFGSGLTALKAATAVSSSTSSSSSTTTTTTTAATTASSSSTTTSNNSSTTSATTPAPVASKPVADVKASPALPPAPAQPPLPPASSSAPAVSAEEKLRLFALQSMKKQVLAAKPAAPAAPVAVTSAAPTAASSTPTKPAAISLMTSAAAPVKLPPKPATGSSEEDALKVQTDCHKLSLVCVCPVSVGLWD